MRPRFAPFALLLAAIFATGTAGLVHQVVWQRYVARLLGSGHVATAVTLAIFLAGLSAGAALAGRATLRVRRPLLAYAVLEGAIGAWAFFFPVLFRIAEGLLGRPGGGSSTGVVTEALLAATLLILPPTLLMGGTIPFLTRAAAGSGERAGSVHAALYAVNTFGAVAGVLGATFLLLPRTGLPEACRIGGLLNFGAGAVFVLLAPRSSRSALAIGIATELPERAPLGAAAVSAVAFLTGAATMLLENALSRFVALSVGGSVQAFGLVVAAFVLGIAVGGAAVSRTRRIAASALEAILLGASAAFLALFLLVDTLPYVNHVVRIGFAPNASGWTGYWSAVFLLLSALLLVPVGLLGAALPLLFHEGAVELEQAGRRSGALLSANALGSLVGSFGGGVLLHARIGSARLFLLAPLLLAVAAAVAVADRKRFRRLLPAGLLAAASLVALAVLPGFVRDRFVSGTFRLRQARPDSYLGAEGFDRSYRTGAKTVYFAEDPTATVGVLDFVPPGETGSSTIRAIFVNGKSDSGTGNDLATMRLSADLPALLAADPRRALVVGLGTGISAGELALHPSIGRIDVFEISTAVIGALPSFARWTGDVGPNPKVVIAEGDAMIRLRRSADTWDVVSSEPSNPWVAGVDQLFSEDFYRLARAHLAPGGVFLQWIHLYEANLDLVGTYAATLHSVFPCVEAYRGSPSDLLLVASSERIGPERWDAAARRLAAAPAVLASLRSIGVSGADALAARRVAAFDSLLARSASWLPNTLDHPRLQPMAARAMFEGTDVGEHQLETPRPSADLFRRAFSGLWNPEAKNPGEEFAKALIERAMEERRRTGEAPGVPPPGSTASVRK